MRIYDSEKFLKRRLMEESSYSYYVYQKFKEHPFKEREVFYYMVRLFCKNLYFNKKETNQSYINYFKKTVKQEKGGWYSVDKPFGKGRFINANKVFKFVECEDFECHKCAYDFALEAPIKTKLVFGSINPFRINNGLFHSICIFKLYDKEYVFDGSNYMVMEKDLYYKVFNFMELQKLSQEELLKDKEILSQEANLKQNIRYKIANFDPLREKFYGIGFLTYLYNRKDFLSNNKKQCENYATVVNEHKNFKEELEQLEEEFSTEKLTIEDILNENRDK